MTTKDYRAFAALYAGELASSTDPVRRKVREIILSTGDIFAQGNPRFNRATYYKAAGIGADGFGNELTEDERVVPSYPS